MIIELPVPARELDLEATFSCGQCFRWERREDGAFEGIAFGRELAVRRRGELLELRGAPDERFWRDYFDLDRDYAAIRRTLSQDPVLGRAIGFAPGIRILRQEPWEALCSFIVSQNNNIPRIRGILSRLCEHFGQPLPGGGFAFPSAEGLSPLGPEDLAPLRSGFRASYILDAARRVASGEVRLDALSALPLGDACAQLTQIRGVGPKVAACALLFGCGRVDSFPVDVWVRRVLGAFYPDGFPDAFTPVRGIAQQYLFHYARCCPECEWPAAQRV